MLREDGEGVGELVLFAEGVRGEVVGGGGVAAFGQDERENSQEDDEEPSHHHNITKKSYTLCYHYPFPISP